MTWKPTRTSPSQHGQEDARTLNDNCTFHTDGFRVDSKNLIYCSLSSCQCRRLSAAGTRSYGEGQGEGVGGWSNKAVSTHHEKDACRDLEMNQQ